MHVPLLATSWTAAYQAPPSTGFSRQEYGSGVPLPSPQLEHYSLTKKKKASPFAATWMDLGGIMLSKIHRWRKTNTLRDHLHVESKKYNKVVNITKKKTHRYREQTGFYQ